MVLCLNASIQVFVHDSFAIFILNSVFSLVWAGYPFIGHILLSCSLSFPHPRRYMDAALPAFFLMFDNVKCYIGWV